MANNARVVWAATPKPWVAEKQLIGKLVLPLNLDQNRHNSFHAHLSATRAAAATARPTIAGVLVRDPDLRRSHGDAAGVKPGA
jgi:hypothetical protein